MAFSSLDTKKNELIRKTTDGLVMTAPYSAAVPDTSVMFDPTSGELIALPTGYTGVGYLTTDGASFKRDVKEADISSWGSNDPTRSDRTNDTTTLSFSCQETNAQSIAQYVGVDPANIVAGANGVVTVKKPETPQSTYRRVLTVGIDDNTGYGEIVIMRFLPRAKVTDFDDQTFSNDKDAFLWPVTYTGYKDSDYGTSEGYIFGGPGWLALLSEMGFRSVTVSPASASVAVSGTQQLTVVDQDGTDVTASATFVSATPSVATVSVSGLVTGVAAGTAVVTATYQGASDTSVITVA